VKVGDVISTTNIRVLVSGEGITGSLGYVAPKGEAFVFVLLGSHPIDGPALDPVAIFEALGWRRDTKEPDRAHKALSSQKPGNANG
jgi:hypothetical protein